MQIRYTSSRQEYQRLSTQELRDTFLIDDLFPANSIHLTYWETDRAVVGSAVPVGSALKLETAPALASETFCQRRELGIINLGGAGQVLVDGAPFSLGPLDGLYIGRGSQEIIFSSKEANTPAKFCLVSYPAHTTYPTTLIKQSEARQVKLGSQETANDRIIYQYIHEDGVKSCQLVLGFTQLYPGSVWNTMPPHTHLRRSEIYVYFQVPAEAAVVHLMGPGDETRHLLVHNEQAVLSPIWSIHSGCGTRAYSFIWAMGGENQRFVDMDGIPVAELR